MLSIGDAKSRIFPLPLEPGSASFDQLPINDIDNDGDAMDVDGDETMFTALQAPTTSDYGIVPEFSELEDDLRDENSEAIDIELTDKIHDLNASLEKDGTKHARCRAIRER